MPDFVKSLSDLLYQMPVNAMFTKEEISDMAKPRGELLPLI
jgi:hypothetical protein